MSGLSGQPLFIGGKNRYHDLKNKTYKKRYSGNQPEEHQGYQLRGEQ
jgi:hypothetical protein